MVTPRERLLVACVTSIVCRAGGFKDHDFEAMIRACHLGPFATSDFDSFNTFSAFLCWRATSMGTVTVMLDMRLHELRRGGGSETGRRGSAASVLGSQTPMFEIPQRRDIASAGRRGVAQGIRLSPGGEALARSVWTSLFRSGRATSGAVLRKYLGIPQASIGKRGVGAFQR